MNLKDLQHNVATTVASVLGGEVVVRAVCRWIYGAVLGVAAVVRAVAVGSTAPRLTGRPPSIRNRPLPAQASTVALTSRFSSATSLAQSKLAKLKLERQEVPRTMAAKQRETPIFSPQGKLMTGAEVMSRFGANAPAWMEAPQRDPRPPAMGRSDDSKQLRTAAARHLSPRRMVNIARARHKAQLAVLRTGTVHKRRATAMMKTGRRHRKAPITTRSCCATRIQRLSRGRRRAAGLGRVVMRRHVPHVPALPQLRMMRLSIG